MSLRAYQCLRARQRRAGCAGRAARAAGPAGAGGGCRRGVSRHRHPRRQQCARPHLRAGQPARDARLRGRQDRHQQGHARQLVHRLHRPLHDRRLGRQRQRRGDARRQRRQRRGAGLARARQRAACRRAVTASGASGRRGSKSRRVRLPTRAARDEYSCRSERVLQRAPGEGARPSASASRVRATAASSRSTRTSRGGAAHHVRGRARRLAARGRTSASAIDLRWAPGRAASARAGDAYGQTLQSVGFEVRGAGVRARVAAPR